MLLPVPMHLRRSALLLASASLVAACAEPPANPMRKRYGDPVAVDVGGLSLDVQMVLRPEVLYGAGIHSLYQIDRRSGAVLPLLIADDTYSIAQIAADDTAVYAVLQRGGGTELVRIPKGGGAPQTLLRDPTLSVSELATHGGDVYVLGSQPQGTPPATIWRQVILAVPGAGGDVVEVAEVDPGVIATMASDDAGLLLGRLDGLVRVPYAGGAATTLHALDGHYVADIEVDPEGLTWTMRPDGMLPSEPNRLYASPAGATTPDFLAEVDSAWFATNQLGFYWVDYDHRAIRAIAKDDLAGEPFALFTTGDAPLDVVADDHGLAYSSDDGDDDGGDLELHLVPLVE